MNELLKDNTRKVLMIVHNTKEDVQLIAQLLSQDLTVNMYFVNRGTPEDKKDLKCINKLITYLKENDCDVTLEEINVAKTFKTVTKNNCIMGNVMCGNQYEELILGAKFKEASHEEEEGRVVVSCPTKFNFSSLNNYAYNPFSGVFEDVIQKGFVTNAKKLGLSWKRMVRKVNNLTGE